MAKILYGVYENDKEVFEGTCYQIADVYGCQPLSVASYCRRHSLLLRKYEIKRMGLAPKEIKPPKVTRKKTKDEEYMEYLTTHLKTYGNVALSREPTKWQKMLRDKGIDVEIRTHYEISSSIPTATSKAKRKGRIVEGYTLERI